MSTALLAYEISPAILTQGILRGLGYGLLAVGLVLAYRSSRFINFAHSAIGVFAAMVLGVLVVSAGMPYWLAFPLGLAVAAIVGVVIELVVVRRLVDAPRVLAMIATLGLSQVLVILSAVISGNAGLQNGFPAPPGFPTVTIGALEVGPAASATAILTPIVLVGIWALLRFTRAGIGIRAAAANPDAALLAGVSPELMARISWGLAGALAMFSATLFLGEGNVFTPQTLGPSLLVRGLAAASIARFRNMWVAMGCGIGIGAIEAVLATGSATGGLIELVLLAGILAGLAGQRRGTRDGEDQRWDDVATDSRPPRAYRDLVVFRWSGPLLAVILVVVALLVTSMVKPSTASTLNLVVAFALVGASVALITGLGGQLSLGQFGIAGVGAAASVVVVDRLGEFNWGPIVAMVVGGIVAALIGLPALRVRGLQLGVVTLAFALVASNWLLGLDWLLGENGIEPGRPLYAPDRADFLQVSIICLAISLFLLRNLRAGAFGRKLVAVRDNEGAARAMSVSAMKVAVQANVIAGVVAGLGGALLAHGLSTVRASDFAVGSSIDVVSVTVIGGLGSLFGPLFGSAYLIGIPGIWNLPLWGQAVLNLAWIVLILLVPGGLATFFTRIRRSVQDRLARLAGYRADDESVEPVEALEAAEPVAPVAPVGPLAPVGPVVPVGPLAPVGEVDRGEPAVVLADDAIVLEAKNLKRYYGSVAAVDDVSLVVRAGETVGLIGPNGAGKTTLFELFSGFLRPDSGTVSFLGTDVTSLTPNRRSQLGMARSFQSATLFPTLSLLDTVMVARERRQPSTVLESLLGRHRPDRAREDDALALIETFGLAEHADLPIGVLPTGTRRLVELACAVALEPTVLLLDEPSAGIAQSEVEQLSGVLRRLRDDYVMTLVIIEHDLPMLSSVCDRMIAMELGKLIAEGSPAEVQQHPAVIESYMGTEQAAISRSGAVPVVS